MFRARKEIEFLSARTVRTTSEFERISSPFICCCLNRIEISKFCIRTKNLIAYDHVQQFGIILLCLFFCKTCGLGLSTFLSEVLTLYAVIADIRALGPGSTGSSIFCAISINSPFCNVSLFLHVLQLCYCINRLQRLSGLISLMLLKKPLITYSSRHFSYTLGC